VLQAIAVMLDEFPLITLPYAEHYFGQDIEKVRYCCFKLNNANFSVFQFTTYDFIEQDKNNLESAVL